MVIVSREHPDIEDGIHYPSSDGKPMAETDIHVKAIHLLLDALTDVFADQNDVYVSGTTFWYWREGHPHQRRSPDAMVVFGVKKRTVAHFAAGTKAAPSRPFASRWRQVELGERISGQSIETTRLMAFASILCLIRRGTISTRRCSGSVVAARSCFRSGRIAKARSYRMNWGCD